MPSPNANPNATKPKVHGKRMKPLAAQDAKAKPKNKQEHDNRRQQFVEDWLAQVNQ